MPHSFSSCPLRSSSLLITNHATQCIVTATDEVLDLLGYSMSDLVGHSIHSLNFQLSSQLSFIPECTIQHANGDILDFQVCVHQDPLGGSSCLDYWLIRRKSPINDQEGMLSQQAQQAAISVIRLSPYGTIEQVQPSPHFKQSISELIGRPVMAFVYQDDVEPLCASLSKICSIHQHQAIVDPLFIRWSKLPCFISTMDYESSLNYDWMSFTLMASSVNTPIRPICIIRPLQVDTEEDKVLVIQQHDSSLLSQLLDYSKFICNNLKNTFEESATTSKIYLNEFYHHVVSSLLELISAFIYTSVTTTQQVDQDISFHIQQEENKETSGFIWDFIKSNSIMQKSLTILEFTTGLLHYQHQQQQSSSHFKSYMETLAT